MSPTEIIPLKNSSLEAVTSSKIIIKVEEFLSLALKVTFQLQFTFRGIKVEIDFQLYVISIYKINCFVLYFHVRFHAIS